MPAILVVDDEPLIVQYLQQLLEEQGHIVWAANHAVEAMELLRHRPVVAIVDLLLPDIDGIEVIRSIKQVLPETAVIAISGVEYGGFDPLDAACKVGADAALKKPILPDDLLQLVIKSVMSASGWGRLLRERRE
jgi:CheY-like chemotaxis protein